MLAQQSAKKKEFFAIDSQRKGKGLYIIINVMSMAVRLKVVLYKTINVILKFLKPTFFSFIC